MLLALTVSAPLTDGWSTQVRHAALLASVAYLTSAEPPQLAQSLSLLYPMLETLPTLAQALPSTILPLPSPSPQSTSPIAATPTSTSHHLSTFLSTLTPLCSSHPTLFAPHLPALLTFLPALILPSADCGPTPTVGRPFPNSSNGGGGARQGAFVFPPPSPSPSPSSGTPPHSRGGFDSAPVDNTDTDDDERQTLRLSALEFMLSLCEARPGMVRGVGGWVEVIVRACLEGMGEIDEEEGGGLGEWLAEDVSPFPSFHLFLGWFPLLTCSFRPPFLFFFYVTLAPV